MARGPAYPYFDLKKAINMAKKMYDYTKRSATPVESLVKDAWGFSATSSSGVKALAAMKYFGLIEDVQGGSTKMAKLTDRAYRILVDSEDSQERIQEIQKAALSPRQYKYCWDTWGADMPSDSAMRSHLIFEREFHEGSVDAFLRDYKSTIRFAGLDRVIIRSETNSDNESDESSATLVDEGSGVQLPPVVHQIDGGLSTPKIVVKARMSKESEMRQETFTFDEGDVVLQWPATLTPDSFEDFSDWIELVKRKIQRSITKQSALKDGEEESQET